MAICKDKIRKKYYISYKYKINDTFKTYNIRNKDWSFSVGIKYMRSIENEQIELDLKKRKLSYHSANNDFQNVLQLYLKDYEHNFKKKTAYNHACLCNKYFKDINGDFAKETTQEKVIEFIDKINELEDISIVRKNLIKKELKQLLVFAYERDYISHDQLKKSSVVIKAAKESKEFKECINFWTNDEFKTFIESIEEKHWQLFFNVCYYGALRIGELLGLKFEDINQENNTIHINKEMTSSGELETTKTSSSNNVVSLPKALINDLIEFEKESKSNKNDLIFKTSRTSARRYMNIHANKVNLKHITLHGLRHSMASYMINKGVDIMIISKHLRHSSTQMTYDTYCHLFPTRANGVIDNLFN